MTKISKEFISLIKNKNLIVCVGAGGVGKTTLSATLSLVACYQGKKTLVITIDPAKRLASSLGIDSSLKSPQRVNLKKLDIHDKNMGQLDAMMLDMPHAWDDMILRLAKRQENTNEILQNRYYYYLSRELAGSQEFIACETLYHLFKEHKYDFIVLDTPPAAHALDFLDAPKKIIDFLDQDSFHKFITPKSFFGAKFSSFLVSGASNIASTLLSRIVGKSIIKELADFLYLLRDLYSPLLSRVKKFQTMLSSEKSEFIIITSPANHSLHEAKTLLYELKKRKMPIGAVFFNQIINKINANFDNLESKNYDKTTVKNIKKIIASNNLIATLQSKRIKNFKKLYLDKVMNAQIAMLPGEVQTPAALLKLLLNHNKTR